jgi:long-chain acyl-CoA synthetase
MTTLRWHPNARFTDQSGFVTTAAMAATTPAARISDPTQPHIALPAFFNALSNGQSPQIGANPCAPDVPDTFFTQTGGTTGTPKCIRRSAASWLHSIAVLQKRLNLSPAAQVATLGDLSYSFTLYAAIEALVCGAHLHFLAPSQIAQRGITHLYATPTQLRILRIPPVSCVRHILTGGGPMDSATTTRIQHLFPNAEIIRFYGAAETSFITLGTPQTPAASVGPAFPGADIHIRNARGQRLDAGQPGTVWVRSPMLFHSYASGTSASTKRDGDWLTVGEIGQVDTAGNLFLTGRSDRILTIADQSVSLDAIESDLIASGATTAAVIAQPNALRGHVVHGFVVTPNAAPTHPFLKSVTKLATLPLRPSGKPDYAALTQLIT